VNPVLVRPPSGTAIAAMLAAAVVGAACAPLPMRLYVGETPQSTLVYSTCSFNTHVPVAVRLTAGDVLATLALAKHDGRPYVQLQLDIPTGTTVAFDDDAVSLQTVNPSTVTLSRFPSASLVDTPILNSYSTVPAAQRQQVSVRTPLVGGSLQMGARTSDRHFWLATYVDTASAEEVTVSLPRFRLNGVSTSLPPVRFRAQTVLGVALINC